MDLNSFKGFLFLSFFGPFAGSTVVLVQELENIGKGDVGAGSRGSEIPLALVPSSGRNAFRK